VSERSSRIDAADFFGFGIGVQSFCKLRLILSEKPATAFRDHAPGVD